MAIEYRQDRSLFWLKIFENDNHTNVSASKTTKKLAKRMFPQLEDLSPIGWKKSQKNENIFNLWIPDDRMELDKLEDLKSWAEAANRHIWLSTNQNTKDFFVGDELDYCVAADWNFSFEVRRRTEVGEAEYNLKYGKHLLAQEQKKNYVTILKDALTDCVSCLPFDISSFIVTTIPAIREKQTKLSWNLAKYVARYCEAEFMPITLLRDKPDMKSQQVEAKIRIWRNIYADTTWISPVQNIDGENILIVDDLYQSGASTWCYGEYLKSIGAHKVIALSSVKALKDGDNT